MEARASYNYYERGLSLFFLLLLSWRFEPLIITMNEAWASSYYGDCGRLLWRLWWSAALAFNSYRRLCMVGCCLLWRYRRLWSAAYGHQLTHMPGRSQHAGEAHRGYTVYTAQITPYIVYTVFWVEKPYSIIYRISYRTLALGYRCICAGAGT